LTTRLDSISITRLFDRKYGAAVRLIGHLWIAMQSFHQGYALTNQYFGGLKGLRIRTPGRRQGYRIGGGSDGLLLGAHIRMCLSHGALLEQHDCGLSTTSKGEYWRIRTGFGGFRGTIWFGHLCNRVALWPLASLDTCSCGYRYLLGLAMPADHPHTWCF
jgi:hypothetical protein